MAVGTLAEDPDFDPVTELRGDQVGHFSCSVVTWPLWIILPVCVQTLRYSEDSEASHLERILCGDEHLQTLLQSIKVCLSAALAPGNDSAGSSSQRSKRPTCVSLQASLHSAFHAARVYAHTLEPFRLLFKENQGLDLGLLRQRDHGRSRTAAPVSSKRAADAFVPPHRFDLF